MVTLLKEKLRNRKFPSGHVRGIGLAVVNPQGEIWIQRDMGSKLQTDRQEGELSIIFETQKSQGKRRRRESHRRNVLGAIPELVNDETLSMIKDTLVTTDGLRSTPELTYTTSGGAIIHYIVSIGVLDASVEQFSPKPFDSGETEPVGWMRPKDLLAKDNVRLLARDAITYMLEHGVIDRAIARYHSKWHRNKKIIPRGFGVAEFYDEREQVQDMDPGVVYPVAT